ncbi:MAG TPA: hypothetical protein VJC07_03270 [Candidatus Nanoarchaeia archaeon]|nr:hypothetical protein [Candidatus Nanoarchaeia archaeon]
MLTKKTVLGIFLGPVGFLLGMRINDNLFNDPRYKVERWHGRAHLIDTALEKDIPIPDNFADLIQRDSLYLIERDASGHYVVGRLTNDRFQIPKDFNLYKEAFKLDAYKRR